MNSWPRLTQLSALIKMKYITVLQSSNSLHPMFVWSPSFRRFKLFAWCWDLSEYVFCRKKNFNYKPLQMNSSMKLSEPKVSNFHQILNMQLFKKNNYFLVDWNFHWTNRQEFPCLYFWRTSGWNTSDEQVDKWAWKFSTWSYSVNASYKSSLSNSSYWPCTNGKETRIKSLVAKMENYAL